MNKHLGALAVAIGLCLGLTSAVFAYQGLLQIQSLNEQGGPFPYVNGEFHIQALDGSGETSGSFMTDQEGQSIQAFEIKLSSPIVRIDVSGESTGGMLCRGGTSEMRVLDSSVTAVNFTVHCSSN